MPVQGAQQRIKEEALQWDGVTIEPHRFGGVEFKLGRRELGHIHGDALLDIPFPMPVRNELVDSGQVLPHHVLPKSGWISFYIRAEEDVLKGIELLRMSYDIAVKRQTERAATG